MMPRIQYGTVIRRRAVVPAEKFTYEKWQIILLSLLESLDGALLLLLLLQLLIMCHGQPGIVKGSYCETSAGSKIRLRLDLKFLLHGLGTRATNLYSLHRDFLMIVLKSIVSTVSIKIRRLFAVTVTKL